ncbi:universal stress protein UspA [Rhodococcus sp. SRB_17]|nr:universal stress protein UspA [Rhodococcus sp. SRB_17]
MYTQILVPIDGSPTSDHALGEAAGLAQLAGARVRLLHIVDPMEHTNGFERPEVYHRDVLPGALRAGEALLRQAQERLAQRGVQAETALVQSLGPRVAQLVVEQAQQWGADLIVLGTQGRRGLPRLMMGSDAEQVARTAPVPVLLVRGAQAGAAPA